MARKHTIEELEFRANTLTNRTKENGNIVSKIKRQIRNLKNN